MKKIESGRMRTDCGCDPDCVYNSYSVEQSDEVILERSSPRVYRDLFEGVAGDTNYGHFGTDVIEGLNYDTSYYLNMGADPILINTFIIQLNIVRRVYEGCGQDPHASGSSSRSSYSSTSGGERRVRGGVGGPGDSAQG